MTKIMDGKFVSNIIINEFSEKVKKCTNLGFRKPSLAVIIVGNDFASLNYVNNKKLACKKVGFSFFVYKLENSVKEFYLLNLINRLNKNTCIDGIIVQLPLPKNINYIKVLNKISPKKDVDCFHPYNLGKFYYNKNSLLKPCTSNGIVTLLKYYNLNVSGMNTVIVGSSILVGKPLIIELLSLGCTITITNSETKKLKYYITNADLLIVGIGKSKYIPGKWIKKNSIVIDVGINRTKCGKIVGDVNYEEAINKASYITPVPGGVGPMTIAMIIKNTFKMYKKKL